MTGTLEFYLINFMPYPYVPPGEEIESSWVVLSNQHYDPRIGHRLYQKYLETNVLAERLGFDGVLTNEHHQTAYGNMPNPNLPAAWVVAQTERIRIGVMGNVLNTHQNPLRVAEDIAMLDVMSGGRIISGFVLGTGMEYHSYGINPATSRERFWEAHDLIIKSWTEPGPFPWESKHFNLPYVNPWPRPLQQPHPPVWLPGVSSAAPPARVAARRQLAGDDRGRRPQPLHLHAGLLAPFRAGPRLRDVPRGRRSPRLHPAPQPAGRDPAALRRRDRPAGPPGGRAPPDVVHAPDSRPRPTTCSRPATPAPARCGASAPAAATAPSTCGT